MKFLALFKKDVKCLMPLFIITIATFIMIVYMIIMIGDFNWASKYYSNQYRDNCMIAAIWLFVIFGFLSGLLQFLYFLGQTKSWAFLLHRSVSRLTILSSLILSFCFMIILLGILEFIVFNIMAAAYKIEIDASFFQWLRFLVIGLIFYLAVVLCYLSRARWFTTKLFPLIFAFITCFLVINDNKNGMTINLILSTAAVVILLTQIINLFVKKEV